MNNLLNLNKIEEIFRKEEGCVSDPTILKNIEMVVDMLICC